jgi:hypothetical protein
MWPRPADDALRLGLTPETWSKGPQQLSECRWANRMSGERAGAAKVAEKVAWEKIHDFPCAQLKQRYANLPKSGLRDLLFTE